MNQSNAHSPYESLPSRQFWRTGVTSQPQGLPGELYKRRFDISKTMRIATAGSCFAQHIARNLKLHGFTVVDVEPAPSGLSTAQAQKYGYGLYSARYANIYVIRQLVQLIREARGEFQPSNAVWEKNGRYYDAFRPSVEPNGLPSPEAVLAHRRDHLSRVDDLTKAIDVMVFTFGLTEAWIDTNSGAVYPTAPGTIAGTFDPNVYAFKNFTFNEIYNDFVELRALLREANPDLKFLVTVSPVPLTATASPQHVLTATTYSKSVLRAVTGQIYEDFPDVDYFPSYEIIATPVSRGMYYNANLRTVSDAGVEAAMSTFLGEHLGMPVRGSSVKPSEVMTQVPAAEDDDEAENDVVCEEVLLEAFAR